MINTKDRRGSYILSYLSERSDLNGRPLAPHASALANCATPRKILKIYILIAGARLNSRPTGYESVALTT